ncbi:SCO family protein [Candidatus Thiothrix sp. Deng01]|uniref:SCO family protein n=1 Tax=Candidatus Thiothrix phosphatis TaxID=3112415 RepID=A0ABU6CW42_9GAMM|nr:SCO family protein [Candidatus Thiothrix sp. Deng01]MEB4591039.1 SCO family protein [Candidatus Thiothrix sp. Deng01]
MNKFALIIGLLAFALGLGAAQYFISRPSMSADEGSTVVPVVAGKFGGDFTLMQGSKPVSLNDFKGKVVVMYFGYASCPDICPTTLSIIASGLKELTPDELAQVQPIFISVDPERDSGDKLMAYATHFHPSFIGITGSPQQVQQAAKQYGAYFAKVPGTSAMGYTVDHTSQTYLVSKDGQYVKILPHNISKKDVVESIRDAL